VLAVDCRARLPVRRYWQGKRIGKEITLYSVWFELRWGLTSCLILTVSLITVIFYNHPSTTNVTLFFRTVPIISETTGRVAEVFVPLGGGPVEKGAPIFRLDSSKQEAAVESARARSRKSMPSWWLRAPTLRRPKVSCRRPTAITSRS